MRYQICYLCTPYPEEQLLSGMQVVCLFETCVTLCGCGVLLNAALWYSLHVTHFFASMLLKRQPGHEG